MVSNLYDGLDWYKIPNCTFSRSVPTRIAKNVIIPVQFFDKDTVLITGGTSGTAKLLDARTAETIQTLEHNCKSYSTPVLTGVLTNPIYAVDDTIQTIVCCTTSQTPHTHTFRRLFTFLRGKKHDTSQPGLLVKDQLCISGFPRPRSSQDSQRNLWPSPLFPWPQQYLRSRSGFSTPP